MNYKLDITTMSVIRVLLVVLGALFLYYIRDIIVLLFLVLIIVAGLSPTVERWAKTITRPGAVISVFLVLFLAIGLVFTLLVPPLIEQLRLLGQQLPVYAQILVRAAEGTDFVAQITQMIVQNINNIAAKLGDFGGVIFTQTVGIISGLVAVIMVVVLTFYILLEEDGLRRMYRGILPEAWHDSWAETTKKISSKLGAWLHGQIILMAAVGTLVTIGLLIIGSPYALILGLWAALTGIVPIVGAFLGAIPGVAVGFAESPLQGFLAMIVYLLVQQLENNILVPRIMAKAVGLNPVIVIIAILIGGELYGLMGVLLSVPLAAVISVIVEDWSVVRESVVGKKT